jgi:hypothetical protein
VSARVIVALRVDASPTRAFEVFTKEVGLWWRPNAMFQFTPRSPGTVSFEGELGGRFVETLANGKVFEIGRITAWEPGVRLAFGWRQATFTPDQHTEVDVRFEPVGEETRVTVEHRGWDCLPAEHVARHGFPDAMFLQRHGAWWGALLSSLGARRFIRPSLDILRAFALTVPETVESAHMGTPDFGVHGKIFAIARADGGRAVLKLPLHIQEAMIQAQPDAFSLIPSWGRHGWTFVETDKIDDALLQDLLDLAWRRVAPKKLAAAHAASPAAPMPERPDGRRYREP